MVVESRQGVKTAAADSFDTVVTDGAEGDDPGSACHDEVLAEAAVRPLRLVVPVRADQPVEDLADRQGEIDGVEVEHRLDVVEKVEGQLVGLPARLWSSRATSSPSSPSPRAARSRPGPDLPVVRPAARAPRCSRRPQRRPPGRGSSNHARKPWTPSRWSLHVLWTSHFASGTSLGRRDGTAWRARWCVCHHRVGPRCVVGHAHLPDLVLDFGVVVPPDDRREPWRWVPQTAPTRSLMPQLTSDPQRPRVRGESGTELVVHAEGQCHRHGTSLIPLLLRGYDARTGPPTFTTVVVAHSVRAD